MLGIIGKYKISKDPLTNSSYLRYGSIEGSYNFLYNDPKWEHRNKKLLWVLTISKRELRVFFLETNLFDKNNKHCSTFYIPYCDLVTFVYIPLLDRFFQWLIIYTIQKTFVSNKRIRNRRNGKVYFRILFPK